MGRRGQACALGVLAALALVVAGCSDNADKGTGTGSTSLTVYSSLPLQGPSRPESLSIINGEKMALEEAGSQVGKFTIRYVSMDDSSASAGGWDPGVSITNARTAVQDKSTIAYLGDFDSGASAISIPLLNEAAILQISPSNSDVGLTQSEGADKGEPEKYYPSGKRTFGRMVPADQVQAAAQVDVQRREGCTTTYLADDNLIDGGAIARRLEEAADDAGLKVAGGDGLDPARTNYQKLAGKIQQAGANCLFFGGNTALTAISFFSQIHAALPAVKLFGSAGLATPEFAAALAPDVAADIHLTSPALDPKSYPAAGREFFKAYAKKYGYEPEPYSIYGYEAMRVALASIRAAGNAGNDRQAVTNAFFRIRDRHSVLGTYSIDVNGDTSIKQYAIYSVAGGKLVHESDFTAP